MSKLTVERLPSGDAGRLLVRLNHKHRNGIPRYGIAKITNVENDLSVLALLLGHSHENSVFMPYDIRTALRAKKGAKIELKIENVGIIGKFCWYLGSPDPAIYLPAWIAALSASLAVIGVLLTSFAIA